MRLFYFTVPPIYVFGNVVLDANFQEEKKDDFKSLEAKIYNPLRSTFCDGTSDCVFSFTRFRQGSVIANFLVAIATGMLIIAC